MSESQVTPEVLWAQRSSTTDPTKNYVWLTISASDVPKDALKLDIQPTKLTFTGTSTTKKVTYHVEIDLYAEIDPAETKTHHSDRDVELVLRKKELKEEYWPRLLKDSKKVHYLKTNFDKWVDEDEQEAVTDDDDYMARMGGAGAGGGDGGFGGIDFSKLGGGDMGGMGAMGAMGGMGGAMGGADDSDDEDLPEGDDDDDEDMPALEGEEVKAEAAAEGKGKAAAGIEEVE